MTVCALAQHSAGENEPVPPRFEAAYFKQRPEKFLIDPQRVLSREDFNQQLEFLDYHSGDSAIDLYVYVLPGNQEFPEQTDVAPLIQRLYDSGKPAVIVHYFMGRPGRTGIYLSPELARVVPLADQQRALEMAVAHAEKEPLGVRQMAKFMVQMSIQIYWMERLLKQEEDVDAGTAKLVQEMVLEDEGTTNRELLVEVAKTYGAMAGGVVSLFLLLVVLRWWFKKRARYRFVDLEVEPRLGGPHGAGVGAVISFASAAVPPASQRQR